MVNLAFRIGKFFAQKIDEPCILLQREQRGAALRDLTAECAEPWPNFQNKIFSANLSLLDDPAREVLIVQKILPEFLCRTYAGLSECCSNL